MYLDNILVFNVQHVSAIIICYHQAMKKYVTKEHLYKTLLLNQLRHQHSVVVYTDYKVKLC
jgi:hypothetical protein